jgi:hypothetical protein
MKCPYCFRTTWYKDQRKKGSRVVYYCPRCKSEVPKDHMESKEFQFTNIGMIGYTGHGKTTYLISILHMLKSLHKYWDEFFFETLDDKSHAMTYYQAQELEQGIMPASTRAIYPMPTFIRLNHTPYFDIRYISLFDTGGQLFENLELMTRKGRFYTQAKVIFFLISLSEKDMTDNWNLKIMKLLDRYVQVVYSRYGTKTSRNQNIVFILTKSDELLKLETEQRLPESVINYYKNNTIEQYGQIDKNTFDTIKLNSDQLEKWLRSHNCNSFINLAKSHFRNVSFALTSVFEHAQSENNLTDKLILNPRCVLDPLIWSMNLVS